MVVHEGDTDCFFADYEVHSFGLPPTWGSIVHAFPRIADHPLDPQAILPGLMQRIADRDGVERCEIRIRALSRL